MEYPFTNQLQVNVPILYLLKTPKNQSFWSFQRTWNVNIGQKWVNAMIYTAWKVSVFGVLLVHIFLHSDWIRGDTEYSVQMRENADQNNSEYKLFLRSDRYTN